MKFSWILRASLVAVITSWVIATPGLAASGASEPATATATQAATQPLAHMSELMGMRVVGGMLVLERVKELPINTVRPVEIFGITGGVTIRAPLNKIMTTVQRVYTRDKVQQTQIVSMREGDLRVIGITYTNLPDSTYEEYVYTQITPASTDTPATKPPHVTLTVSRTADNKRTEVIKLDEPSFAILCEKHPDEVQKYMEPVLRDLDLGGVFFIDPREARHLFADKFPPAPAAVAKLEALLPKLNDDAVEIRTAASKELWELGDDGAMAVRQLDLAKQPMQTRIILKNFLADTGNAAGGTQDPRLSDVGFLVLCLALEDPHIVQCAKDQLAKVEGKPVDLDASAPVDKRREMVRKLLLARWSTPLK